MEKLLENLNPKQSLAVRSTEGVIRLVAGAGTGKTKTLTHRYAYICKNKNVSYKDILSVTFTNKAANEMKSRIINLLNEDIDEKELSICTFHSFGVQILRRYINCIPGYKSGFIIMDTDDQNALIKKIITEFKLNVKPAVARNYISKKKNSLKYIEDIEMVSNSKNAAKVISQLTNQQEIVYMCYLYQTITMNMVDFDDLIALSVKVLKTNQNALSYYQSRYKYVQVDEFQDTNYLQYELIKLIVEKHKNLFIVGDPDQSIYGFRGAEISIMNNMHKDYPGLQTIIMDINYRSTKEIIDFSNASISKNEQRIQKTLHAVNETGQKVYRKHCYEVDEQARFIAKEILNKVKQGYKYSDFTILYRNNHSSRKVEEAFVREKIPYILFNATSFYKRAEIKDMLSYLRFVYTQDDLAFIRIINQPKRNLGNKWVEALQAEANQQGISLFNALSERINNNLEKKKSAIEFYNLMTTGASKYKDSLVNTIQYLYVRSGYEKMLEESNDVEKADNVTELILSISNFEKQYEGTNKFEDYFAHITLMTSDNVDDRKNSVKLMTIHASKGLEFPVVFLVDFVNGSFPRNEIDDGTHEEERRVAYVAFTRAEKELYLLTHSFYSTDKTSIFLEEVNKKMYQNVY